MYDAEGKSLVTREMIVEALRDLGIAPGDMIQVHSSLSALGYVEGGAEAVVDALLETVGPAGTVMVPTFNHGQADIFDVRTTPSVNGAVTEALRKRPEAKRSVHPTHPYAAIGPRAEWLTCEHLNLLTFDQNSPLGKLAREGGWVVLLGVGMNANTAAHIGETLARVPCIGYREHERRIVAEDGSIQAAWSVLWRDGPCLLEWDPLEQAMRDRGMIRDASLGDGRVMVMKAQDVIDTACELTRTVCPKCTTRPRRD